MILTDPVLKNACTFESLCNYYCLIAGCLADGDGGGDDDSQPLVPPHLSSSKDTCHKRTAPNHMGSH